MKRLVFTVSVTVPDDVSVAEVAQYIREEVDAGGGNRHPDDPLFQKKNTEVVQVKRTPNGVRGRWA